jgi:hypothetical protein
MRQVPDPSTRLLQHPHRWRTVKPLPLSHALSQDRPHERKRAVDRCIAAAVGKLGLCYAVNHVAVDGVQLLASQMRIQPAQLGLVFFCSGLVCLFVTPTDHGVVSGTPNDVAQHAPPPRLGLQSIAQGPTAGMQRRVSLTLC